MQVQTNSNVEFNLGKFNVPTIVGIMTIIGLLINMTSNRTELDTKVTLRLDNIEANQQATKLELADRLRGIDTQLLLIPNLTYKTTTNENAITATNARVDRQTDAIGRLTDGISEVSSDLKLLTQRLEIAVPLRKSELVVPMSTPRELK